MELEELKTNWMELEHRLSHQEALSRDMLLQLTRMKVHGKLAKVTTYETVGGVVCLFAAVVVLAHIKLFDTWPLMASVILSLAMMIGLPIASWITLGRMKQLQMGQRDLATTLREFARRRSQFLLVQKWGVISSVLMMIAFIPVTVRISSGDDVFQSGVEEYIWVVPVGIVVILILGRWGYRCYSQVTWQAREMLLDLDH